MELKQINSEQLYQMISENPQNIVVIDVRENDEFLSGHIKEAYHLPLTSFTVEKLPNLNNKKVIFYCRSGYRSQVAAEHVIENISNLDVFNLKGGIIGWSHAGFAIETKNSI